MKWPFNINLKKIIVFLKPRFIKDNFERKQRNYILPTKMGLLYGTSLFLLLIMALTYANNLVFMVCFFLSSLTIVSILATNRNVKQLNLEELSCKDFFADQIGEIKACISNPKNYNRYLLKFNAVTENNWNPFKKKQDTELDKIPAQSKVRISIPFKPSKRGIHLIDGILVSSHFPLNLFWSWKPLKHNLSFIVFPSKSGTHQFPIRNQHGAFQKNKRNDSTFEFKEHREYQLFHSPRSIDWKASARAQKLLSKHYENLNDQEFVFSWSSVQHLSNLEEKLSQLSLWIDLAERRNQKYQLVLPNWKSPLSQGYQHWLHCLKTLALTSEDSLVFSKDNITSAQNISQRDHS